MQPTFVMNKKKFIKTKKTKITYSNILRSRKYERKKKATPTSDDM